MSRPILHHSLLFACAWLALAGCGGTIPPDACSTALCGDTCCAQGQACDPATHTCHVPTCEPACSGETPECDTASLTCQCTATSCGSGWECKLGSCQELQVVVPPPPTCEKACSGATPGCDVAALTCVCDQSSCPAGQTCGAGGACLAKTCAPACAGETPDCDAATLKCVCSASSCPSGRSCTHGACVQAAVVTGGKTIADIVDASKRLHAFVTTNSRLPSYVTMGADHVDMPSFLMLEVTAVLEIDAASSAAVPLKTYAAPASIQDDTTQGQLPKAEVLSIAGEVQASMKSSKAAPGFVSGTSRGNHLGFTNLVYLNAKALEYYGANQHLPSYVVLDVFSKGSVSAHPVIFYVNPNATPTWDLAAMKQSGITDVFMLASRSSSSAHYFRTFLPKIKPSFQAAGLTLHAWVFEGFTAAEAAEVAAMGINLHVDLEGTGAGLGNSISAHTSYVAGLRAACPGRIFTIATMPDAPGVDSGAAYGQDYRQLAQHVDAIVPMLYQGNYNLSNATLTSAAAYMQKEAPGKLWIALETYQSDQNPTALSASSLAADITAVKASANGIVLFRYGLTNYGTITAH